MDWVTIQIFLLKIDWATLSNIAVVVSVFFIVRQLGETRRTTQAQSYSVAREILQDEKVRRARQIVFQLGKEGKSIKKWTKGEIQNAEIVCHTYDSVGQMVRHKLLWKNVIIDSWGTSIRNIWPIVSPLINKYRKNWDSFETWDDFEWLFNEAQKFEAGRRKKRLWIQMLRPFSKRKRV